MQLRTINNRLKELGHAEQLVKGDGYFYFIDGTTDNWKQVSVYTFRVSDLSLSEWIEEHKILKADIYE